MLNRQKSNGFKSALAVCLISKQIDNKIYSYNYFSLLVSNVIKYIL